MHEYYRELYGIIECIKVHLQKTEKVFHFITKLFILILLFKFVKCSQNNGLTLLWKIETIY